MGKIYMGKETQVYNKKPAKQTEEFKSWSLVFTYVILQCFLKTQKNN